MSMNPALRALHQEFDLLHRLRPQQDYELCPRGLSDALAMREHWRGLASQVEPGSPGPTRESQLAQWMLHLLGEPSPWSAARRDLPWLWRYNGPAADALRRCLVQLALDAPPQDRHTVLEQFLQSSLHGQSPYLQRQNMAKHVRWHAGPRMGELLQHWIELLLGREDRPSPQDPMVLHLWLEEHVTLWPAAWDRLLARNLVHSASRGPSLDLLCLLPMERLRACVARCPAPSPQTLEVAAEPDHEQLYKAMRQTTGELPWSTCLVQPMEQRQLWRAMGGGQALRDYLRDAAQVGVPISRQHARVLRLRADADLAQLLFAQLGSSMESVRFEATRALAELLRRGVWSGQALREALVQDSASGNKSGVRWRRQAAEAVLVAWAGGDLEAARQTTQALAQDKRLRAPARRPFEALLPKLEENPWFAHEEAWARAFHDDALYTDADPARQHHRRRLILLARLCHQDQMQYATDDTEKYRALLRSLCQGDPWEVITSVEGMSWRCRVDPAMAEVPGGQRLLEYQAHQLRHGMASHPTLAMETLVRRSGLRFPEALRALLRHGSGELREALLRCLVQEDQQEATAVLLPLLQESQAELREIAAHGLGLLQVPQAQDALRQALPQEKSQKVLKALQQALHQQDSQDASNGTYAWEERFTTNDLLQELRHLLYQDPSPLQWARLCDVLDRLHQAGQAALGVDYLQRGQHPAALAEHCERPWHWTPDSPMALLGLPNQRTWITVAAFRAEHTRAHFLAQVLPTIQKPRAHKRLDPQQAPDFFLEVLAQGWAVTRQEGISPELLHLRLDGGQASMTSSATLVPSLELLHGFGVLLHQATATRCYGGSHNTHLARFSLKLPPRHPLRVRADTTPHVYRGHLELDRWLDIRPR